MFFHPSFIQKENYGYFIPIIPEEEDDRLEDRGYLEDLLYVIRFAIDQECDWIMPDVDGTVIEELHFGMMGRKGSKAGEPGFAGFVSVLRKR